MRRNKKIVKALLLMILILCANLAFAAKKTDLKKAPDFTVKSLSGKNIKLSEQRGRVVILNFWATWCTPCKKELPYFNSLYKKYKGVGLQILGVNIDKGRSEVVRMSRDLNLAFPVLLDPKGKISDLYLVRSMPTTYVIGKDGLVHHVHWGFGPDEPARYEKEIRALLKQ